MEVIEGGRIHGGFGIKQKHCNQCKLWFSSLGARDPHEIQMKLH